MRRVCLIVGATLMLAACAPGPHAGGAQVPQLADEQRACAAMGTDPGSPQFADCVGNLDAILGDLNNVGAD
jgi:hypothetical protein